MAHTTTLDNRIRGDTVLLNASSLKALKAGARPVIDVMTATYEKPQSPRQTISISAVTTGVPPAGNRRSDGYEVTVAVAAALDTLPNLAHRLGSMLGRRR